MLFRTILCPVDFSGPSRLALRFAATMAKDSGAELTAVFVDDPLLSTAAAVAKFDTKLMAQKTRRELAAFVQKALSGCGVPARTVHLLLVAGRPPDEITAAARSLRADLIVMGTRGLGRARGFVLGSTTEAVLAKSSVPVLAIPPGSSKTIGQKRLRERGTLKSEL
jgi:nucleotide-binding universal stress UspA family protein